MKLYGLAHFPLQFYKEASVTFLGDISRFYSEKPYFILAAISICALPFLNRKEKKTQRNFLQRITVACGLIIAGSTVFLTITLGILKNVFRERSVFYGISLPVLFSLFLYLAGNFDKSKLIKPFRHIYVPILLIFVLLFLAIPVGYGSYLYDITVFTVSIPECSSEITAFGKSFSKGYRLLYLMGHTSEREIFFDATARPITVILVDKKLINSIRVEFSKTQVQTLRTLYEIPEAEYFDTATKEQTKIIPEGSELMEIKGEQLDEWLPRKEELSEKVEDKKK